MELIDEIIQNIEPYVTDAMAVSNCLYIVFQNYSVTRICQDLDWLAVYMTYIQISLLGINGIVAQGDTLKEPYNPARQYDERRILRTPGNTGALL